MVALRSVNMARHRRGSYILVPILASGVTTPEIKRLIGVVIQKQEGWHKVPKYVLRTVLEGRSSPFILLADYRQELRAWCKQCPPSWKKI